MMKIPYKKVDAFTSEASKGNPAAYLLLGDQGLNPEDMLEVGKAHAGFVSEVIFCEPSAKADMKLTYYSSECEVDFCGHGTIAVLYDQIRSNPVLCAKREVVFETNRKGTLRAYNRTKEEDAVYITAPQANHLHVPVNAGQAAAALGIDLSDISAKHPLDFIDAGLRTLLVPIRALEREISIFPSQSELRAFCADNEIDIVLIFCLETSRGDAIAHTRVFAPKFGYLEDPATGSGNSAFGNYLLKNRLWDGEPVSIEQGGKDIVFNSVRIQAQGDALLFGGKATVRIEGHYFV